MIVIQEQFLSEEQEAPTINAQFSKILKTFGSQKLYYFGTHLGPIGFLG